MMRLAGGASLGIVLLLLASVSPAAAECAWVLWVESRSVAGPLRGKTEWTIKQAVDTRAECVSGLDIIEKEWREKITPDSRHGLMRFNDTQFTLLPLPGGYWHTEYRCLPDSIDPRGAKGD